MDTPNPLPPMFDDADVVFVYTPDDAAADGFLGDLANDPELQAPAEPLFELGRVLITPGVLERLDRKTIVALVNRHQSGDWGDLEDQADVRANDRAVRSGADRVFSAYDVAGERVWVITEWDRSATTVCFPHEY